jgi:hypothetical protein
VDWIDAEFHDALLVGRIRSDQNRVLRAVA